MISGIVVAKLTIVAPITYFGIPSISDNFDAASTNQSPPLQIRISPIKKRHINHIQPSCPISLSYVFFRYLYLLFLYALYIFIGFRSEFPRQMPHFSSYCFCFRCFQNFYFFADCVHLQIKGGTLISTFL